MVEYGGNSPPSSPCKGDVIILYQYPMIEMVSDAGFEPALFFTPNEVPYQTRRIGVMEHRTDHDTVYTAWKAVILPLN